MGLQVSPRATSLMCPRCDLTLFEGQEGGTTLLHGCGRCGGVWLDNEASQRVIQAAQSPLVGLSDRASKAAKVAVDQKMVARCPFDKGELRRVTVQGIALDVCVTHGTWFDAGEVRRIAAGYQSSRQVVVGGGATYDYAVEVDRQQSDVRDAALGGALELMGAFVMGAMLVARDDCETTARRLKGD